MTKIGAIKTEQPKRRNANLSLAVAGGAAVGALSRYVIPNSQDLQKNIFSKQGFDEFIKNDVTKARGEKRSILAFASIGAIVAGVCAALSNKNKNVETAQNVEYTKLGALVDAPDYACEIMWYGD